MITNNAVILKIVLKPKGGDDCPLEEEEKTIYQPLTGIEVSVDGTTRWYLPDLHLAGLAPWDGWGMGDLTECEVSYHNTREGCKWKFSAVAGEEGAEPKDLFLDCEVTTCTIQDLPLPPPTKKEEVWPS